MELRLTYAGSLLAHKRGRSKHIHTIRQQFHEQLKFFWTEHPVLNSDSPLGSGIPDPETLWGKSFFQNGCKWKPIVTEDNGLVCALDILMLRKGRPGRIQTDIDNRLKTLFDALRMPGSEEELGENTEKSTFFVLLKDDHLITRVAVTSDMLLEPVQGVERAEDAVRLVIHVTIRPYRVTWANASFVGI